MDYEPYNPENINGENINLIDSLDSQYIQEVAEKFDLEYEDVKEVSFDRRSSNIDEGGEFSDKLECLSFYNIGSNTRVQIEPSLIKGIDKLIDPFNTGRADYNLERVLKYYNNSSVLSRFATHNITFLNQYCREIKEGKEVINQRVLGDHSRSMSYPKHSYVNIYKSAFESTESLEGVIYHELGHSATLNPKGKSLVKDDYLDILIETNEVNLSESEVHKLRKEYLDAIDADSMHLELKEEFYGEEWGMAKDYSSWYPRDCDEVITQYKEDIAESIRMVTFKKNAERWDCTSQEYDEYLKNSEIMLANNKVVNWKVWVELYPHRVEVIEKYIFEYD